MQFVTTKVWTTHFTPNDLERSAKESLTKLRLSEVDLLLLHWPNPHVPLQETLGALAHVKKLGMWWHIGVSNFTVALIEGADFVLSDKEMRQISLMGNAKVRLTDFGFAPKWD